MTFFYLHICKFITWMNYLYPVNSILWKFELIHKIFPQILFAIKKHIIYCKLFLAKFILFRNFEVKFIFLIDTIHIFFFIVQLFIMTNSLSCIFVAFRLWTNVTSTLKIIEFSISQQNYKLKTNRTNVVSFCKKCGNYSIYCCLKLIEAMKQ